MSLEHMLRDEQESWRLLLDEAQREGEFEMTFQQIDQRLQEQLAYLDSLRESPNSIISFSQYKAVYDTLIALRQTQALERIADNLDGIRPDEGGAS